MNLSPLTIYLWQLADQFQHFMFGLALVSSLPAVVCAFWTAFSDKDYSESREEYLQRVIGQQKVGINWLFRLVPATFIVWVLATAIPSSKTIAMMVIIPEIAHSKVVQQDLPDIYNAAVKALKDQLTK